MLKLKRKHRENLHAIFFLLPALILFTSFVYFPLSKTLFYSFTDWDGFSKSVNFVGVNNFVEFFHNESSKKAFGNTIFLAIVSLVLGSVLQLGVALVLDNQVKGKGFLKAVFYIPVVVSPLIIAYTWNQFFQYIGIVNQFLSNIHLDSLQRDWLGDVGLVKIVLVIINTLQWLGFGMIIYLTGLNSISDDIYEAARIDGAGGFKKFTDITLPLLMPAITINLFISITGSLKIFDLPFALTRGGPAEASKTITMEIFNSAFSLNRFGYASSISFIFFVFIAIITIFQLRMTKKREVEY